MLRLNRFVVTEANMGLRSPAKNLPMNLRAPLSVSGFRIVFYSGKLYNFAYVAIALNYANLSRFSPRMSGFITFSCRNSLHCQTTGWSTRSLTWVRNVITKTELPVITVYYTL